MRSPARPSCGHGNWPAQAAAAAAAATNAAPAPIGKIAPLLEPPLAKTAAARRTALPPRSDASTPWRSRAARIARDASTRVRSHLYRL